MKAASVWETFREGSRFFASEGGVHKTLSVLASRLDQEGIEYAVIGALALAAHGYRTFTEDLHVLLEPEGLIYFRETLLELDFLLAIPGAQRTFRDTRTGVKIEIVTTGEYPGDGKPKRVVFPHPREAVVDRKGFRVLGLENLIELKLASGLSAPHRLKDLADVQELILHLRLPLSISNRLDESVRAEYERLWRAAQQAPEAPSS